NALSEKLEVWVDRDGQRHHMAFERGETTKQLEVIGKAKGTGTTVWFQPDPTIFTETRFDYATLATRLRELAFLNKGLTITLKKEEFTLTGDDVREGLTAVLHVKVKDPQFEGQTKTKLGNSEVEGIVKSVVNDALGDFFDKSPSVARTIIAKAVSAARAREAA